MLLDRLCVVSTKSMSLFWLQRPHVFFLFVTNVRRKGQTVFLHRREHANTKHRQGTRRGRVQRALPYFLCEVRKKQGGEGVSMEIGDAALLSV